MASRKTDCEIVESCNNLAREFLRHLGFNTTCERLYDSENPRAQLVWEMAVEAFDHIEGTSVHDALIEVQEEDAATEIEKFAYDPVI